MEYRLIRVGDRERGKVLDTLNRLPKGLIGVYGEGNAVANVNVARGVICISPAESSRLLVDTSMKGVEVQGSGPDIIEIRYNGSNVCVKIR